MHTTLVIGATDRGKTTFVARRARESAAGAVTLVLDADTGQSEIGPPTTVGLAQALPNVERLHDLKPAALFFVGALTPAPAALEHVVSVHRAVDMARALGAERLLIDTPGWVSGPAARRWLAALTQSVRPQKIIGIGLDGELDDLLRTLGTCSGASIETLTPMEGVVRKPPGMRATRRTTRLAKALEGSRSLALPLDAMPLLGATLGTGIALPPEQLRWCAAALKTPLARGEIADGVLSVFPTSPLRTGWESLLGPIAHHFGVRTVRALPLAAYAGALLGLHDGGGKLLSLGLFAGIDAERGELLATAPLSEAAAERLALVAFGRIRCAPDGSDPREIKPGEL